MLYIRRRCANAIVDIIYALYFGVYEKTEFFFVILLKNIHNKLMYLAKWCLSLNYVILRIILTKISF